MTPPPPKKPGKAPAGGKLARKPARAAKPRDPGAGDRPGQAPGLFVGIGASAGGLDAFRTFFTNMPPDSGMAFVLVQHLSPDHKSMLADLIGRVTAMQVTEARDGVPVAANRVYVIPPDATLTIERGALRVARPAPPREHRKPIDTFFASLAGDQGENAVCIVLSGTGSDGTLGLAAIKEQGGLSLAQAEFDHHAMGGMPHSAAATGLVDDVMPVEKMPARLLEYQRHLSRVAGAKDANGTRGDMTAHLAAICTLLRLRLGHDFSQYKEKTLLRRIQRRMQVLQTDTVPDYIARLKDEPGERDLLFAEFLIGVTHFFRDAPAFEALARVVPTLVKDKGAGGRLRIWVPGCATGEEAYSIAILVHEAMERLGTTLNVQIFGTDIDERAVAIARAGRYRTPIPGVSPERIERWFAVEGDESCPIKAVREMCVFSPHSLVKDPPFSRLDLISCRNLLIYLDAALQDRVVQTFHYALRPGGTLFLGTSEGLSRNTALFTAIDKKHRIFRRRDVDTALPAFPPSADRATRAPAPPAAAGAAARGEDRIDKSARRALEKFSPVHVVIDEHNEILRFSGGEAGHYLEPAPGAATLNLFGILRKPLRPVVRAAMTAMAASQKPVVHDGVALRIDGEVRAVRVIVAPLGEGGADARLRVIAFLDTGPLAAREDARSGDTAAESDTRALEQELHNVRAQLQAATDEFEIVNEEMKSSNEEYQAVNEELQSTNEELETAKEEMQSVNEELQTINAEMIGKNEQLHGLNNDLKNLFDSTDVATIFLDNDLRVKSFTPGMTDIFHLRDADRGRPITEIVTMLSYADLARDARKVIRTLSMAEHDVQIAENGATYIMRIRPYRTIDNVLDGVVVTFVDVTERKRAEQYARRLAAIVEASDDAIVSKDLDGIITSWNNGAEKIFGYTADEVLGKPVTILMPRDRHDEEPEILERVRRGEFIRHYDAVRRRKDGSLLDVSLSVSPLRDADGRVVGASKIVRDMTEQRRNEEQYRTLFRSIDEGFCIIEKTETMPGQPIDFRYLEANPGFEKQTGVGGVVGKTIREALPAEPQEWFDIYDAVLRTGEPIRFERDLVSTERVLELYAFRLEDTPPQRRVAVIFKDITGRKQAEAQTALLLGELDHRVKNILAIVSSVIRQTLKGSPSPDAFAAAMEGRIEAIARAHSQLNQKEGRGEASLRELVATELGPYGNGAGNVVIDGAELDIALTPKAGLAVAMAIHELASNAAKYGALSVPGGRLAVTWETRTEGDGRVLTLAWTETGGPAVRPPSRRGFGTTLIERAMVHEFEARVDWQFPPAGLRCTIEIPLTDEVGHPRAAAGGKRGA